MILIKKTKREKRNTEEGNYVRNADLLPIVLEAKKLGKVTDALIIKIQMIAVKLSLKYNFVGYSFREDMVASAVANLCNSRNALKFDPERSSNPFSFYTTAIYNSFLQYLQDEKNHRNIRDALLIDAGSNPSFNFLEGEMDESHFELSDSDNIGICEVDMEYSGFESSSNNILQDSDEPSVIPQEETLINNDKFGGKSHGKIMRYKVTDYIIDPITNEMTLKPDAIGEELAPLVHEEKAPVKKRNPFAKKKKEEPIGSTMEFMIDDSIVGDFINSIDESGTDDE